jgi:hypothetical protein
MKYINALLFVAILGFLYYSHKNGGFLFHGDKPVNDTIVKIDTAYQEVKVIDTKEVKVTSVIHDSVPYPQYIPDTLYPGLKLQYEDLLSKYLVKNVYDDSFPIGTYGRLVVRDTVQFNKLGNRSYDAKFDIPTVTNTVTVIEHAPKKNELYVGGGVAANRSAVSSVQVGMMMKTKNDKIIGTYIAGAPGTKITYGVQYYVKLGKK